MWECVHHWNTSKARLWIHCYVVNLSLWLLGVDSDLIVGDQSTNHYNTSMFYNFSVPPKSIILISWGRTLI